MNPYPKLDLSPIWSMSVDETAQVLACSRRMIEDLIAEGQLQTWILGTGARRILVASIEAYIERQREAEAAGSLRIAGIRSRRAAALAAS